MSNRITDRDLQCEIDTINRLLGTPVKPYSKVESLGGMVANIGNVHLDSAYGGVKAVQMVTDGGGITDLLGTGYTTKRSLWEQLLAFEQGIRAGRREWR